MIITCPQCATRYRFEAQSALTERETVRCGRCRYSWQVVASNMEQNGAEAGSGVPPPPQGENHGSAPAKVSGRSRIASRLGQALAPTWVLLLAAAVAIVWSAAQFTKTEPRNPLSLDRVLYSIEMAGPKRMLRVNGVLLNSGSRALPAPRLEAVLMDARGRKLDSWEFELPVHRLAPHAETSFTTEFANPPLSGRTLLLSFAER